MCFTDIMLLTSNWNCRKKRQSDRPRWLMNKYLGLAQWIKLKLIENSMDHINPAAIKCLCFLGIPITLNYFNSFFSSPKCRQTLPILPSVSAFSSMAFCWSWLLGIMLNHSLSVGSTLIIPTIIHIPNCLLNSKVPMGGGGWGNLGGKLETVRWMGWGQKRELQ
jgi:hypothetical protein